MCGLATLSGPHDTDRLHSPRAPAASLSRLMNSALGQLAHRGPDGTGTVATGPGRLLGHRRLAVIDPATGAQPLVGDDGEALVANGMIYNDLQLREELGPASYRTGTDSESILHAVRHWGTDAPRHLDGMFAFVYADGNRVIAARDPLGIKPLYQVRVGDAVGFCSEAKALDGVADQITEFPAGHVFDSRTGLRRYYEVPRGDAGISGDGISGADGANDSIDAVARRFLRTLEAAVVKRLRSDVPFGALLSGGLDSSLICALARRHVDTLHTFAIGLPGSPDLDHARLVADHLGTRHHELVVRPGQIADCLPKVLWHLESADLDLVRSAVVTYLVMQFAAQHVTVVLTGEGADELFAGYAYHRDYTDAELLHAELRRSLAGMHNVNLQRVDRMSMAHGVEARVPFLDTAVVAEALRIPAAWKRQDPTTGQPVEKWILRHAAAGLLPQQVLWRTKAQFDQGSGMAGLLPNMAAARERDEATWYVDLLRGQFARPDQVLEVAGTWATGRTNTEN